MARFSFTDTFDATVKVFNVEDINKAEDDETRGEPELLPIHVARLDRGQLEELDREWDRVVAIPPGANIPPDKGASNEDKFKYVIAETKRIQEHSAPLEKDRWTFFETTISRYVTLDEGIVDLNGHAVKNGAGLIALYHGRRDILRDIVRAVIDKNHLSEITRKNSKSPFVSAIGSAPSTQERPAASGTKPERTATNADNSNSAASDDATGKNESLTDGSKNSRSDDGDVLH